MNKQIVLSLGVIVVAAAVIVGATGAFFSDSASATGNVFAAGTLDLKIAQNSSTNQPTGGWLETQTAAWNFSQMAPGGTPEVSSVWLKNEGSVDGMHVGIAAANAVTTAPNLAPQLRIASLKLGGSNLLSGGAGATIGAYDEPTHCDVTATPGNLASSIGAATPNQVICVDTGSYTPGSVSINAAGVTLVALHGPNGGGKASVEGTLNVAADDVTIRGFNLTNPGGSSVVVLHNVSGATVNDNVIENVGTTLSGDGSAEAIYFAGGSSAATGLTIKNNTISHVGNENLTKGSSGGSSAKGVYIGDSSAAGTLSNVVIENNIITDVRASALPFGTGGAGAYGVMTNLGASGSAVGTVDNLTVKNNTISDLEALWSHAVGLEGPVTTSAAVALNDVSDLVDHKGSVDAVGVNVEDDAFTSAVDIHQNNLADNVPVGIRNAVGGTVDGRNNWWGDQDPSDQISGSVNTTDFASGPFAGLINGTDFNSNGYADLQDLANTPLTGAPVTINAGQERRLVMAVQLDGPTTDNSFQGAGLTTNLTITLEQQ